jgi:hypothetical protein
VTGFVTLFSELVGHPELVGHLHFCNIYGRKEKLPVWMDWQLRMQPKFWFFGPELVILLQFSH